MHNALLMHPITAVDFRRFTAHPSHALLIYGPAGIGKTYTAMMLAAELANTSLEGIRSSYPHFVYVTAEKDKSTISIESIRQLHSQTKLKVPKGYIRIILIDGAHMLGEEAQNALLKLLEEPPQRTIIILTTESLQAMLPTIRSRSQSIKIMPPLKEDSIALFGEQYDSKLVDQAYLMSGGLPGLMHALLNNNEHPMIKAVQMARKILQSSQFERLCIVESLLKDKVSAMHVIYAMQHMSRTAMEQAANLHDGSSTKRIAQWYKIRKAAYQAEKAYDVSAQAKLTLTNLMLSL